MVCGMQGNEKLCFQSTDIMPSFVDSNFTGSTSELVAMTTRATLTAAEDFDIRKSQYYWRGLQLYDL